MEVKKGVTKNYVAPASIVGKGTWTEEEFGSRWYQEKTKGLWTDVVLYINEDGKQEEGF